MRPARPICMVLRFNWS